MRRLVLIAGKDPLTQTGGHSSYVRAHARAAIRLGWEPHLFCVASETGHAVTDFGVVHRTRSPFRPFRQTMVPGHAPLLLRALDRALAAAPGPLLIHSFGLWGAVGVTLADRLRRRGGAATPIVSCYTTYRHEMGGKIRGLGPAHGWRRRLLQRLESVWVRLAVEGLEARAYTRSRLVLLNYESVHRILRQRFPAAAPVRRLPYTAESALLPRPPAPASRAGRPEAARPPLVLSVSRHDPRKGLDVLLRALALLRRDGVPVRGRLVGPGGLLEAHRRLAGRLGVPDVEIPGFVPDPAASRAEADVFVLPSLQEGSGSVALIEAMQAGLPIVASRIDGLVEDVTDGHDGLLVPPADPGALAGALRRLLADPALRLRLAGQARATFERRFDPDAFTDALGATYAELAGA